MLLLSLDVLPYHLEIPKASLYIQLNISSKLAFEMKRQMNTKLTQQVPILQRLWVLLAFLTSRFNRRFWHLQVKQKSHKANCETFYRDKTSWKNVSWYHSTSPHGTISHYVSKRKPNISSYTNEPWPKPKPVYFYMLAYGAGFRIVALQNRVIFRFLIETSIREHNINKTTVFY